MSDFAIYPLAVGDGALALSPIPGRSGAYGADFARLRDWGPAMVLTMTTQAELEKRGATTLGADCATAGIDWRHLPIPDFGVPPPAVEAIWPTVSQTAQAHLRAGRRVLSHCHGGCGRSGMMALRLLVEMGQPPDTALEALRQVRPCAVETPEQYAWATLDY